MTPMFDHVVDWCPCLDLVGEVGRPLGLAGPEGDRPAL